MGAAVAVQQVSQDPSHHTHAHTMSESFSLSGQNRGAAPGAEASAFIAAETRLRDVCPSYAETLFSPALAPEINGNGPVLEPDPRG